MSALPPARRFEALERDEALRRTLIEQRPADEHTRLMEQALARTYVCDETYDYEPHVSQSLAARAAALGTSPWALALEAMMAAVTREPGAVCYSPALVDRGSGRMWVRPGRGIGEGEAVGDYLAGPSHILPTGGTARFSSPLNVDDFLKKTSLIEYSPGRFRRDAPHITRLARLEALEGHARAIEARFADGEEG